MLKRCRYYDIAQVFLNGGNSCFLLLLSKWFFCANFHVDCLHFKFHALIILIFFPRLRSQSCRIFLLLLELLSVKNSLALWLPMTVCQVTSSSVRLVSSTSRELRNEWKAPAGYSVNVATANSTQVYLQYL